MDEDPDSEAAKAFGFRARGREKSVIEAALGVARRGGEARSSSSRVRRASGRAPSSRRPFALSPPEEPWSSPANTNPDPRSRWDRWPGSSPTWLFAYSPESRTTPRHGRRASRRPLGFSGKAPSPSFPSRPKKPRSRRRFGKTRSSMRAAASRPWLRSSRPIAKALRSSWTISNGRTPRVFASTRASSRTGRRRVSSLSPIARRRSGRRVRSRSCFPGFFRATARLSSFRP